jgi:hypothetical protein
VEFADILGRLRYFASKAQRRLLAQRLLLVVLNNLGWTHFRLVRIIPKLSECPALAQEIPALVEFDLQLGQTPPVIACQFTLPIEVFFFLH